MGAMLQVDPTQRLDLATALAMPIMSEPLQRSRDALGLEPPEPVQRRPKPKAAAAPPPAEKGVEPVQALQVPAPAQAEWIGYNTMVRRAKDPILPVETAEQQANAEAVRAEIAGTLRENANWSTAPQRDPDSGDEALDSVSDDSWGEVVETDLGALQQAVKATGAPAAVA